jgi:hypothetical protein
MKKIFFTSTKRPPQASAKADEQCIGYAVPAYIKE